MQEILKAYLLAIKDIKESDKEHTYRPHLYNFLTAINGGGGGKSSSLESKNNIYITHEPNNDKEGRGAPDFLITKDSLTLGYIENKRINAPLDEIAQSDQIKKYFRLSPNTILTDYLRFCFLCHSTFKISQTFKEEFGADLNDNESLNIRFANTLYVDSIADKINQQGVIYAKDGQSIQSSSTDKRICFADRILNGGILQKE